MGESAEKSKLDIGKIDCTEHRHICIEQGVQGYPAFMMYQGGRVLGKYTGKRNVDDFVKFVNEFVSFELVEEVDEDGGDGQCSMDKPEDCVDSEGESEKNGENGENGEKSENSENIEISEKSEKSENIKNGAKKVSDDEISTGSVENDEISTETAPEQPKTTQKISSVQKITKESEIPKTPTFVKFFTSGCPHCINVASTWKLLSSVNFNFDITIAEVNCDESRDFCRDEIIKGLPTLRLYVDGIIKADYKGPRDLVNFSEWIEAQLGVEGEADVVENEIFEEEKTQNPKDEL